MRTLWTHEQTNSKKKKKRNCFVSSNTLNTHLNDSFSIEYFVLFCFWNTYAANYRYRSNKKVRAESDNHFFPKWSQLAFNSTLSLSLSLCLTCALLLSFCLNVCCRCANMNYVWSAAVFFLFFNVCFRFNVIPLNYYASKHKFYVVVTLFATATNFTVPILIDLSSKQHTVRVFCVLNRQFDKWHDAKNK